MGKWLAVNGEAIYNSSRYAFGGGINGTTTARGSTACLHVFRLPGQTACIAGVANQVLSARLLATGQNVTVTRASNGRVILSGLPENPPDPHATVIALELDGEPAAIARGPL